MGLCSHQGSLQNVVALLHVQLALKYCMNARGNTPLGRYVGGDSSWGAFKSHMHQHLTIRPPLGNTLRSSRPLQARPVEHSNACVQLILTRNNGRCVKVKLPPSCVGACVHCMPTSRSIVLLYHAGVGPLRGTFLAVHRLKRFNITLKRLSIRFGVRSGCF